MGAGEHVLLGVCIDLCLSVFIYRFCQSWLIVRLPLPSPPFLLGPIVCWLPSNWPRIVVFGNGAVYRDFGVCRGSSGLGPLGTDGQLRIIPQRILFSLCVLVDLYLFFTLCILIVVVPIYHVTQVFKSSLI